MVISTGILRLLVEILDDRQRESLFNTNSSNKKIALTKDVSNFLRIESTMYDFGCRNRKNLETILKKSKISVS
jgi:hypothetical protein